MAPPRLQSYPRINDTDGRNQGFLDDTKLATHVTKIDEETLYGLIDKAIKNANATSSKKILAMPDGASAEEIAAKFNRIAIDLFLYFQSYTSDPASTSLQLLNKYCRDVAKEQYRNNNLQKERMNSGWRYQFLAVDCAQLTGRFTSVSDVNQTEADFVALIRILDKSEALRIYTSVKNRSNTIGGPDWAAAIEKLEAAASSDKNRRGPYICVFAFVMDNSGVRSIKRTKGKIVRSPNTELWYSNYFWPFFTNFTYEEIMQAVLNVLTNDPALDDISTEIPEPVVDLFEKFCRDCELIDDQGYFKDPAKLVSFFCSKGSDISGKIRPKRVRGARPAEQAELEQVGTEIEELFSQEDLEE